MALEHDLGGACAGIPKVNATILGAGEHPLSIRGQGHREDEVAVTLEGLDALASLGRLRAIASGSTELPHLDGAIETATDQLFAVGGEGDRVHRVAVAVSTLQSLCEITGVNVPNPDALVERSCRNVVGVGGDGHSGDAVLDGKGERVGTLLDVPKSDSSVATAGSDGSAVASKVQGVDVLLVSGKVVANRASLNVPNLFDD